MLRDTNTLCPDLEREQCALEALTRLLNLLERRVTQLSAGWVSYPKWNRSDSDDSVDTTLTGPVLTVPK